MVGALKLSAGDAASAAGSAMLKATSDEHDDHGGELHRWIGVALVLGFVFMLLVDQIGGSLHASRTSSGKIFSL